MSTKNKLFLTISIVFTIILIIVYNLSIKTYFSKKYVYDNIDNFYVNTNSLKTVSFLNQYEIDSKDNLYNNDNIIIYLVNDKITLVFKDMNYDDYNIFLKLINIEYTIELKKDKELDKLLTTKIKYLIQNKEFSEIKKDLNVI